MTNQVLHPIDAVQQRQPLEDMSRLCEIDGCEREALVWSCDKHASDLEKGLWRRQVPYPEQYKELVEKYRVLDQSWIYSVAEEFKTLLKRQKALTVSGHLEKAVTRKERLKVLQAASWLWYSIDDSAIETRRSARRMAMTMSIEGRRSVARRLAELGVPGWFIASRMGMDPSTIRRYLVKPAESVSGIQGRRRSRG